MKIMRIWILIGCVWTVCFGKEFDRISETSKNFRASHFECKSKKWYCQRECRLQFFEASGSCRRPRPDEHCFGTPITYNYTWNHAVTHFPQEYELIKRFPSCWSVLGPLLCSSIYRPCSKNEFYEAGKPKPGILELWQVFPKSVCETARNACPFVVEAGLWPSFLNCEDTVSLKDNIEPRAVTDEQAGKVFSPVSACKYFGEGISFHLNQCLWPLVAGPDELKHASGHRADPLMDSCFMPCETPLAGFDWVLEHFRHRNAFIAGVMGAVFLLITIYLIGFSKIYSSSLSIFCLGQAFLCATCYLAVWVISGLESFRNVGMCIDNGRIRRSPRMHLLDSCALETVFLTCFIISGYLWLFAIFFLRILRPRIRNDNYFTLGQRGNEYSARLWLAGFVYLTPLAIVGTVAAAFWNELPMDAFSGLCHIAAGSMRHSMVYYGTISIAMTMVIIAGAFVAVQIVLQKYRLHSSLRRRDLPRNRQTPLISSIEEGGESGINQTDELPQKLTAETTYAREHGLGEGLISDIWLGAVFGTIALSLGIGLFLQYGVLEGSVGTAWERQRVAESVKCSLSSISTTPPFWWNRTLHHDDITREADPFVRKATLFNAATAPGCNMSVVGDPQLVALFLTAIILPSLPFWILSVCFLAGFCDHGLLSVRKVRRNLNPFIRDEKKVQKLDPFLNAEEQPLPPKEDIELQSVAATAISAPARLQAEQKDANAPTEPTIEESVHVGAASVQSAPATVSREPRRLDLNKKRLEHRRDKKQYIESMRTQSRLFSTPGASLATVPSAYTAALTLPTVSDFTSASRTMPFLLPVPTSDPMVVKYINELKTSQMQQSMQINSLTKAVVDGFSKFDEFTEVISRRQSMAHVSTDIEDNSSTSSSPVPSNRSLRHQRRRRPNEKSQLLGRAPPPDSPLKPEDLTPAIPNDSEEDDDEDGMVVVENVDLEEPEHEVWMLPDPSHDTFELWEQLKQEFDPDYKPDPIQDEEIQNDIVLRLIEHCVEFLPFWLHKYFRAVVFEEYLDVYQNDNDKEEVLKLLGLYDELEACEASAMEALYPYIMPMAVKSVKYACEHCHIDFDVFLSRQSAWLSSDVEMKRLKEVFDNPDRALHQAFANVMNTQSDVSDVSSTTSSTLNRDIEMVDVSSRHGGKRGPLSSNNGRNSSFSSSAGSTASDVQEVKRRRIEDVEQVGPVPSAQLYPFDAEIKENVAPTDAEKTTAVVRPMIVESVPFRELTVLPQDAKREYFLEVNAAYVSSMILNGWVHPPMPRAGYKYRFYIFNFEHPGNPTKIFFEEVLADENDAHDDDVQRAALEKAIAIVNDAAAQYGQGLNGQGQQPDSKEEDDDIPEPSITFPANIQAFLERLTNIEEGQTPFTLEELYPDATVRAAMTEKEIELAMTPMFQAVYVQSLITCHIKGVMEPYRHAALQERDPDSSDSSDDRPTAEPTRAPVDLEAMVSERIDEVPEEDDSDL